MSIIIKTKRKTAEFLLKRETIKRKRVVRSVNFNKASSIGILFDATDKNEFEIAGIEKDIEKLKQAEKDYSNDGYKRMIIDEIVRQYFPPKIYNNLRDYLSIDFENIDGKDVCLTADDIKKLR